MMNARFVSEVKKEEPKADSNEDKVKQLEESLKQAFKDENVVDSKSLIEEIKKLDSENKVALKIQSKLDKAKEKLEKRNNNKNRNFILTPQ